MFDIITARDFYAMLVEDFDDFIEEPHSARRALHCAITAYHMHDWVWADWLKEDNELRGRLGIGAKKSAFASWLIARSTWFQIVASVANGTKHFVADGGFESVRVVAAPFAFDQLTAGWDEGSWDQPLAWEGPVRYVAGSMPVGPKGKGYLLFDLGAEAEQHRYQPVAHILEAVVRMWRDFFRAHRPQDDIPVSQHHVD